MAQTERMDMTLHEETLEEKRQRGIQFRAYLDALRVQFGISKYRLCKATGITWNTLWTWATEKAFPSARLLAKVEKFYKKTAKAHARKLKKGSTSPDGSAKRRK